MPQERVRNLPSGPVAGCLCAKIFPGHRLLALNPGAGKLESAEWGLLNGSSELVTLTVSLALSGR